MDTSKSYTWLAIPAGLLLGLLTSILVGLILVWYQKGFGQSDIKSMAGLATPALLFASLTGFLIRRIIKGKFITYPLSFILGGLIGFVWEIIISILYGPMFGLFSFSVGTCWILGAATAATFANMNLPRFSRWLGGFSLAVIILSFAYGAIEYYLNTRITCPENPGCFGRWASQEMMEWKIADTDFCKKANGGNGEQEFVLILDGTERDRLCSDQTADHLKELENKGQSRVEVVFINRKASYCICSIGGIPNI